MCSERLRAVAVVFCSALVATCSIDDRKVREVADATAGTSSGNGGSRGDGAPSAGGSGGGGGATAPRDAGTNGPGGSGVGAGGKGSAIGGPDASFDAGAGGAATCTPECGAEQPLCVQGRCVACREGEGRCVDNRPSTCRGGAWEDDPPCTGTTPACSNGICALASVNGGIASVVLPSVRAGTVRLVDSAFEVSATTCGTVAGGKVCVTGGIRP
jgi:hypothetical protein